MRSIDWVLPARAPAWDLTRNPGRRPGWEWNPQPFTFRDDAQPTGPRWSGQDGAASDNEDGNCSEKATTAEIWGLPGRVFQADGTSGVAMADGTSHLASCRLESEPASLC